MNKGKKKSYRALSLKIIHYFDHKDKDVVRRDDLLHEVVALTDLLRAPCKGAISQWETDPPGNFRSGR
jgi:hypothetical protein